MSGNEAGTLPRGPWGAAVHDAASGGRKEPHERLRGFAGAASVWPVGIALTLLAYALLHDNSVSLSTAEGYGWTRLIDLPRQIRFVEFGAIVGLTGLVTTRRPSETTVWLLAGCFLFSLLATLSYLRRPLVGPTDFVRLVYMYVLPILVFVIARESPWTSPGLARVVAFVLLWVLVSGAVSWMQYLYLGYEPGDDITGLNQDGHCNVGLLIIAMLLLLGQGLFFRRRLRVLLAVVLAVTAVLPSALKMLFVLPLLVGLLLWYFRARRPGTNWRATMKRAGAAVAVMVTVVAVTITAFEHIDFRSAPRIPEVVARFASAPRTFGPFAAHVRALDRLLRGPSSFLLGVGPFAYSNPISMGQTREGGDLDRFTQPELIADGGTESGEDTQITLTTSLAVELGVPAFLVLCSLYGLVVWRVHRCTRSSHTVIRAYGAAVTPGLLLLLAVGGVAQFASITSLALSWPLMIIAGAVTHLDARRWVRTASPVVPPSAGLVPHETGAS